MPTSHSAKRSGVIAAMCMQRPANFSAAERLNTATPSVSSAARGYLPYISQFLEECFGHEVIKVETLRTQDVIGFVQSVVIMVVLLG
jgi:hypothetical protein